MADVKESETVFIFQQNAKKYNTLRKIKNSLLYKAKV